MKFYEKTYIKTYKYGSRMPGVRWHWISKGETTGSTGAQNLSTTL
jgi:hypothetical protein